MCRAKLCTTAESLLGLPVRLGPRRGDDVNEASHFRVLHRRWRRAAGVRVLNEHLAIHARHGGR
jgi:hypothetical protein